MGLRLRIPVLQPPAFLLPLFEVAVVFLELELELELNLGEKKKQLEALKNTVLLKRSFLLEPVCCKKRKKEVPTKKLVWEIGDL